MLWSLLVLVLTVAQVRTTIVQSLSSSFAVVLGGYGPGYTELAMVEVVKHDKVCKNVIADIPPALARFLGDVSGLAEFVDNKVMFCRHSSCWRLDLLTNTWSGAASLHRERDQAASVALGDRMMVLGGQGLDSTGLATSEVEIYHTKND